MRKWFTRSLAPLILIGVALTALGYFNALRDPIVRTAQVSVADWPEGEPAIRVLAISDIHIAGPDMPPERFKRIAQTLNKLEPDLVVIAGDLVSEKGLATRHYSAGEIASALAVLEAKVGVTIVPGNHEHWAGMPEFEAAFAQEGMPILRNTAVRRGPLTLIAIDDEFTAHDDVTASFAAANRLSDGPSIVVTHSPDVVPDLPQAVAAIFAGHTHCGQIRLPLIGAPAYMSRYEERFACGDISDSGQRIFVTAGLGTSLVPIRFGAPPDVWLVTIGPD